MKVRVKKLAGGENMRTSSMEGTLYGGRFPEIGEQAIVTGDPLELNIGTRVFNTSPVVSITGTETSRTIITESGSVYELEEIE